MNEELIRVIRQNIENLEYSVRFDSWDLNHEQQDAILIRIQQIREILNDVK